MGLPAGGADKRRACAQLLSAIEEEFGNVTVSADEEDDVRFIFIMRQFYAQGIEASFASGSLKLTQVRSSPDRNMRMQRVYTCGRRC